MNINLTNDQKVYVAVATLGLVGAVAIVISDRKLQKTLEERTAVTIDLQKRVKEMEAAVLANNAAISESNKALVETLDKITAQVIKAAAVEAAGVVTTENKKS